MTSASLKHPILFEKYILKNVENGKTFSHNIYTTKHDVFVIYSVSLTTSLNPKHM